MAADTSSIATWLEAAAHHFNTIERSLVNETKHLTPILAAVFLLGNTT